jgi:hypothetical protein
MGTTIHVTDTSGNPITDATIFCGPGCATSNAGSGFYRADINLTPDSGLISVSAPGKIPTVETWWTYIFDGGNVAMQDAKPETSKW